MLITLPDRRREGGFAIVSAIFIIVALAALGVFVSVVTQAQHIGSALDLEGARAYQAARSGTEWGAWSVLQPGAACFVSPTTLDKVNGISVTVSCGPGPAGDGVETGLGAIFSIAAVACNRPDAKGGCPGAADAANYVERRMTVLVERQPPTP